MAEPTAGASGPAEGDVVSETLRLRQVEREYDILTRVFSVVIERLLALTGGKAVEISDEAVERTRGTKALRDESRAVVIITVY